MKIEIWSDVVCPWCYIGKRRFEKALATFPDRQQVRLVYRSFELDPYAEPVYPGSVHEMLAAKLGGDLVRARQMNAHVSQLAAAEGLDFRLDQAKPGNTFDAHRLIHLAASHGRGPEATERLMRAYFTDGASIGDREQLIPLGKDLGLADPELERLFSSDDFAAAVRDDERTAQGLGADGVPFFVFDRRYALSGAQPSEVFSQVLGRAWQESRAGAPVDGA